MVEGGGEDAATTFGAFETGGGRSRPISCIVVQREQKKGLLHWDRKGCCTYQPRKSHRSAPHLFRSFALFCCLSMFSGGKRHCSKPTRHNDGKLGDSAAVVPPCPRGPQTTVLHPCRVVWICGSAPPTHGRGRRAAAGLLATDSRVLF